MKRLFMLVMLVLAVVAIGAKPDRSMRLTYEHVGYGYEGDRYDGVLGADESLTWVVEGNMGPGESYVYTYIPSSGSRWVTVRAYPRKGKGQIFIEIEVVEHRTIGDVRHYRSGVKNACLAFTGSRQVDADWTVTITNIGRKTARAVYSSGMNNTNFGQGCD